MDESWRQPRFHHDTTVRTIRSSGQEPACEFLWTEGPELLYGLALGGSCRYPRTFCKEMKSVDVIRILRWFEKAPGDQLVGEAIMDKITLSALQNAFEVDPKNPMYDCWPVQEKHRELLQGEIDVVIDLSKFDYFVEADARPGNSTQAFKTAEQGADGDAEEGV